MGMDVDKAGRDQQARGIDLTTSGASIGFHRCDDAVIDGHVRHVARSLGAVDNCRAADHEIMHGVSLYQKHWRSWSAPISRGFSCWKHLAEIQSLSTGHNKTISHATANRDAQGKQQWP